jgi:ubiquinone/menaquinone biosynthesis C-methylase UbiE
MGQPAEILNGWRESAKYWAKYSATIRTMFMPLTRALIEQAGIHEGQSVLDVAGGPGEPSLTIAGVVGPRGSVTHTDAVSEMVETARAEAHRRGISNIQFRQCTADSLPFPDNSFDVVVSRLGVMLFADPHASLREMLRVTKPGGVVGCAVWHKSELNPFSYVITDIVDQHVKPAAFDPDAPGAFRFAETGKLSNLMRQAGANDVEENVLHFDLTARVLDDALADFRHLANQARTTPSRRAIEDRAPGRASRRRILPLQSNEIPGPDDHRYRKKVKPQKRFVLFVGVVSIRAYFCLGGAHASLAIFTSQLMKQCRL